MLYGVCRKLECLGTALFHTMTKQQVRLTTISPALAVYLSVLLAMAFARVCTIYESAGQSLLGLVSQLAGVLCKAHLLGCDISPLGFHSLRS